MKLESKYFKKKNNGLKNIEPKKKEWPRITNENQTAFIEPKLSELVPMFSSCVLLYTWQQPHYKIKPSEILVRYQCLNFIKLIP